MTRSDKTDFERGFWKWRIGGWCWKEMFAKLHKVLLAKRVNLVCSLGRLEMIAFDRNLDAKVLKTML